MIHYRPEEGLEGGCLVPADEELPVGVVEEASDVGAAEGESCDGDEFDQILAYIKTKLKLRSFSRNLWGLLPAMESERHMGTEASRWLHSAMLSPVQMAAIR